MAGRTDHEQRNRRSARVYTRSTSQSRGTGSSLSGAVPVRHRLAITLSAALSIILVACEPKLGIAIEKRGQKYAISVIDCANGRPFPVSSLTIYDGHKGLCGARQLIGGGGPPIAHWELTERPSGYDTTTCPDLASNRIYDAQATSGAGLFAARRFKIDAGGAVQQLEATCP